VFRNDGTPIGRRAPHNLFTENNLYTITGVEGVRDLRLERGFSTIEDEFSRLRPKIERREELSVEEAGWLLAFVAAAHVRTPRMRDHDAMQYGHMLKVMDDMQAAMDRMSSEEKRRFAKAQPPKTEGPSFSHEQVRRMAAQPLQETMFPKLVAELKAFAAANMKLGILYHDLEPGFVTSDMPCVWIDPENANRPPVLRGVGVGSKTTEITLPITPKAMVILSHRAELEGYVPAPNLWVQEMNRRTVYHSKEFVTNRAVVNPFWLLDDDDVFAAFGMRPPQRWEDKA